jgi:hypothetical protein
MKSQTMSKWLDFDRLVSLKLKDALLDKLGISRNMLQSMFANGDSSDTVVHYIMKRLENGK